jgi:hypothetical protein
MPAPVAQSKYTMQVENNADLSEKMALAFTQALESLSNTPLGSLDNFDVTIDGVTFNFKAFVFIEINSIAFSSCTPILRRQAYNRLEKFMQIAIDRYNTQYNL